MDDYINIYCDESCHLEHDHQKAMTLGAIWCEKKKIKEITRRLIEFKGKYGLRHESEIKWSKISSNHYQPYLDIIDYFFDDDDLHFRGLIIPDKSILNHQKFNQTHDEWYYKMFFRLLTPIIDPNYKYNIFLDYKDIQGAERITKLHDVLCNNMYDFNHSIIESIQLVKSHHVELIQLTDIIVGALSYNARDLNTNAGKNKIIERIKQRSGYSLTRSTLYRESKFNIFIWDPENEDHNA
ncbi:Phage P1-related protein in restrction modification operon RflA [uncultured spirochete]|uniref:Phage P1-related protein in restrction modification operon RflA n=1 Tax=uncultured spirochete TaxID=156406 RepID=A0A3P3XL79_9SPIR|nr:Phage P1-related protein in restrction modification operon RflA [uncultured spirochete]